MPTHKVWENEEYLAFLDIKPMSKGMTLVIPKEHVDSNFWKLKNSVISRALDAGREVAKILDKKLEGNIRTTLLFEGVEVPHLHLKLIPLYEETLEHRYIEEMTQEELAELADHLSS